MSWQEFVADLAQSLAWPAAVVVLALTFRKHIGNLIPSLESVEVPGIKAQFKRLPKVDDNVPTTGAKSGEELVRLVAEVSPRAQVLEAWLTLEEAVYSAADDHDASTGMMRNELLRRDPLREANLLVDAGWLEPADLDLIAELRGLRNSVVHSRRVEVDIDDAVRYSLAASGIADKLVSHARA